jgi:2-polyprenyl-3-methyl-5-hydroxy-6-metoxy-1,4-benzoquinol methylase
VPASDRCPVCGAADAERVVTLAGGPLRRCRCGHAFLEITAPDELETIYNDHYAGFRDDPVFRRAATRVLTDDVRPLVAPPARLLDVGCGNGEFLRVARDAGYRVCGIDISAASADLVRRHGIDVRVGDLRAPGVFRDDERFDLITFWDVVEHLPDPRSFLARARELLAPGGHVLVKTPGTSPASVRMVARVPRLAGALLQAPSHVQFFQRDGLDRLLRDAGFGAPRWLAARPMRSPAGGGLKRRLKHGIVRGLQRFNGDHNFLVVAERA